jgi:transposase
MWNAAAPLTMTDEQRRTIEAWHRASNTPQGIALRAKIVLLATDGAANNRIATELGINRSTVILWRKRFQAGGVDALTDIQPGRGRRPLYGPERIADIVKVTTQTKPLRWSPKTGQVVKVEFCS